MTFMFSFIINCCFQPSLTYQRDSFKSKSDPDSVNWTHDQLIYSQSLYQLSYIRVDVTDYIKSTALFLWATVPYIILWDTSGFDPLTSA